MPPRRGGGGAAEAPASLLLGRGGLLRDRYRSGGAVLVAARDLSVGGVVVSTLLRLLL